MSPTRSFPSRRQVLGSGVALATLASPFVRAQAAAPIRIGFPIPLTGPYQEEALDMLRGGHTAVSMFNQQGGLHGQTAEIVMRDDELSPDRAVEVTRDLIANEHVNFVTGGLSASVQLAINKITKAAKVPFNSVSQSDAIVAVPDWSPYTYHEALTPHMTTQAVGNYAFSRYGKRVAFLVADYAFGNEMVRGFETVGKKHGIDVVATVRHPLGANDFRPYLQQIQAAKPNVLVLCNFGFDQRDSIQQAEWLGLKHSMKLVAPVLDFTARLALGSQPYEGVVGGSSYYWRLEDHIATARIFNNHFRAMNEGRVPSDYGALGFAGVMTVLTAAKHAGSMDTNKVLGALHGMKYDLYKGAEEYRDCDNQAIQSVMVVESRFTADPNDMDVFRIAHVDPANPAMLESCAAEGHH